MTVRHKYIKFFKSITISLITLIIAIFCVNDDNMFIDKRYSINSILVCLESIDVNSVSENIIYFNDKNDIEQILNLIDETTNLKRGVVNSPNDNFFQNNPSGYIEIKYQNDMRQKIYFTENKRSIYKFYHYSFWDKYIQGNNEFLYNFLVYKIKPSLN